MNRPDTDDEDFFNEAPKTAPKKKAAKEESESDAEVLPTAKAKGKAKAAPIRKRYVHISFAVVIVY